MKTNLFYYFGIIFIALGLVFFFLTFLAWFSEDVKGITEFDILIFKSFSIAGLVIIIGVFSFLIPILQKN